MKRLILMLGSMFLALNATPCEEVMAKISDKIKANGVASFTLEAIDKGTATNKKIVGVCDGGKKDIVYERGGSVVQQNTSTANDSSAK